MLLWIVTDFCVLFQQTVVRSLEWKKNHVAVDCYRFLCTVSADCGEIIRMEKKHRVGVDCYRFLCTSCFSRLW